MSAVIEIKESPDNYPEEETIKSLEDYQAKSEQAIFNLFSSTTILKEEATNV